MRHHTILFLASFGAVSIAAGSYGCGDDGGGEELQTASSGMPVGVGGNPTAQGGGGEGATGGNPTSAMGGSGPTGGSGPGSGGAGGAPEEQIHGCLSTTAIDMTGLPQIDLGDPTLVQYPYCVVVDRSTIITVADDGTNDLGDILHVGGTYDGVLKLYDATSPIQPTCVICDPVCNFDPNNDQCFTGGTWTFGVAGVYPFYNNSMPGVHNGVVYVNP